MIRLGEPVNRGIEDVSLDRRGWRVFAKEDIERRKSFRKFERPQIGAAPVETFGAERGKGPIRKH